MQFKTQRLQSDYESEKKKRVRKEEDLKDAEEQIIKLQEDLKRLEGILERSSKRALPLRGKDDSPEMLPSKKRQIVEVEANAAAIINQNVGIRRPEPELRLTVKANLAAVANQNVNVEDINDGIISLEPELRLDSQGDLVSDEVALPAVPTSERIRMLEQARQKIEAQRGHSEVERAAAVERGRQIVEARRKAKLDESERIRMRDVQARRSAAVESERRYVEAQSKALVIADKASEVTKSPPPEKYFELDKSAQENYHSKMNDYKGRNRRVSPTPDHFENYNAARDAHLSDGQLVAMSLEAWRSHFRKQHDYLPDRDIPKPVHLDHIKIISSVITDFKRQRTALNLWGESAVAYKHEKYSQICQKYHIPSEVCTPKELMRSVERKEMNVLYRRRCCQFNKFYSMLLKDTPGYIPAPDYKEKRSQSRTTGPKSAPPIKKNPASSIQWREEQTPTSGWVRHLSWTCSFQGTESTRSPRISHHVMQRTCI